MRYGLIVKKDIEYYAVYDNVFKNITLYDPSKRGVFSKYKKLNKESISFLELVAKSNIYDITVDNTEDNYILQLIDIAIRVHNTNHKFENLMKEKRKMRINQERFFEKMCEKSF